MKLTKASYEIMSPVGESMLTNLELAGRVCYKSEDRITPDSSKAFISMLVKKGHESVLEHEKITVRFICDRGVSHEIVRHRIASFSQESTRYCNYKGGVEFIVPEWITDEQIELVSRMNEHNYLKVEKTTLEWYSTMNDCSQAYQQLLKNGWTPQQARSVLPNSLKTEIVVTANLREWRTIFKQRTSSAAHPQMRELMIPLLAELKTLLPIVFDDL